MMIIGDCGEANILTNEAESTTDLVPYVAVTKELGKRTKMCLEKLGLYDNQRRVITEGQETGHPRLLLPVTCRALSMVATCAALQEIDCSLAVVEVPTSVDLFKKHETPVGKLRRFVADHLIADRDVLRSVLNELPTRWEQHGDIVLFPRSAFVSPVWQDQDPAFWNGVASVFKARRIGIMGPVCDDAHRTPRVRLVLGDSGWTQHTDNGVVYCFDVTKCMFSSGNVTEKLRIARFSCLGETVVDLFAGIGYFTLPYLVHTGAERVHACEWNPDAVEALRRGLHANRISADRCIIHQGDNAVVCPSGVADRVNLGLLPTSEKAWTVACRALKETGGILHVHHNVDVPPATTAEVERSLWQLWAASAAQEIRKILVIMRGGSWSVKILGIHRVKSYAPHVTHLVADLECRLSGSASALSSSQLLESQRSDVM